jgi:hypothetical protein
MDCRLWNVDYGLSMRDNMKFKQGQSEKGGDVPLSPEGTFPSRGIEAFGA